MASTDVISIGVTTRSRKRAREAALHLLPAPQDPHDRKKFKAEYESPHALSQPLPITRSPVHAVSLQTDSNINNSNVNQSKNAHGRTWCQSSASPPSLDDQPSTNNNLPIPLRNNSIQVIDLTSNGLSSSTLWRNSNQPSVILSSSARVTRSAARRAQLQVKLAQESTPKPDYPANHISSVSSTKSNTLQHASVSFSPASTIPRTISSVQETESASGDSVQPRRSNEDNNTRINNIETTACPQRTTPSVDETISITSDLTQESVSSGPFMFPQFSGHKVFESRNPSLSDATTSGSDDHTKKLVKTSPSSYLAPNPVRRAPRVSTAKRDTARYLLEATEKAALLAYRETRRQFPKWMSNPSRTFFKDSTYIPGGLPIRYTEDRLQLNLKMDLEIGDSESNFVINDTFTLQPSIGGIVSSFQSSHIQLDPDLDPLPFTTRTSSSSTISLLNEPLGADTGFSSPGYSFNPSVAVHSRTKRGLWYNYALSVYQASSNPTPCGLARNDGAFSTSFGSDFSVLQPSINGNMYDVEEDCLDWTTPVPQYYPLSDTDSTSLPISSISSEDSSSGAINIYPEADLLPSLDQPCMTTANSLTDWSMDYIPGPPSQRENGISIPKTPVDLVPPC